MTSPGTRNRNCITDLTLFSTAQTDFAVIDGALVGGTTIWLLTGIAANTLINKDMNYETALCAGSNNAITVNVASGTVRINYNGYVRGVK